MGGENYCLYWHNGVRDGKVIIYLGIIQQEPRVELEQPLLVFGLFQLVKGVVARFLDCLFPEPGFSDQFTLRVERGGTGPPLAPKEDGQNEIDGPRNA